MAAPLNTNIREKILDATTLLLQDNNFESITLAQISKSANISKGTLYYYYNNKEDILFDVTDRYLSKLANDLITWVDNKNKDTSIPRLFKYILERGSGKDFGNLRLYLIGAGVSGHGALRDRYIERYIQFKTTIAQKIAERLPNSDSEYIAWLLLTTMDGILVQSQLANPDFNTDDFIKKTVSLITKN